MIISIRGTSGTGKSTLVRRIMDLYTFRTPMYIEKRKQPYWYELTKGPKQRPLAVLGHYETACGGCDTISSFDEVYALIDYLHDQDMDIINEGVLLCAEHPRLIERHNRWHDVQVISLNTPIDICVQSINMRRAERGVWEPVDPKNTISKFENNIGTNDRLKAAGVPVAEVSRDEAYELIIDLLQLPAEFKLL